MPKTINLLNDLQIKSWVAKREPVARSDGDGLTFTLSAAGAAAFILRYRHAGRRREVTLGGYPDLTLAAAREKARVLRVTVDEGRDPGTEKQEARARDAATMTVRELVEDFRAVALAAIYAPNTVKYRNYDYDQVIVPKLGTRLVSTITATDIVGMLTEAGRTWTISKRILTSASKMFDHAIGRQIVPANPCAGIKLTALKGPRPPIRKRLMLDETELRQLFQTINTIGHYNVLAFKILLATCVRGVELAKARKEHVDLLHGTWWVPDESVKTRQGFMVPLVPMVADWFRELFALAGESAYVLPARTEKRMRAHGGDTHVGPTTLWAALARAFERNELDIRYFTPHDTRSTAKGHMRNMGITREMSEIALNHKLKGMEGIYDVREEIPERRAALAKWAAFIASCETGAPVPASKVVHLRRVA